MKRKTHPWLEGLSKFGFASDSENPGGLIRRVGFIEQSVSAIKPRFEPNEVIVRLGVGYTERFREPPISVLWLMADLPKGKAPDIKSAGNQWPRADNEAITAALVEYAMPWFDKYSEPETLIEHFRVHLKEKNAPGDHRTLCALYFETGQMQKACQHAKAWLDTTPNTEGWAKQRSAMKRQMREMGCKEKA